MPRISRKVFLWLFAAGLVLRLALSACYGTQDVEWQKAWGTGMAATGITTIYGAPDREVLELWRQGKSRAEIREATQRVIPFQPYNYFRTEYLVTYPPGYIYCLHATTKLYGVISPGLPNGRLFNVFINLPPILGSILLVLFIVWFVGAHVAPGAGYFAGLLYWFNPVALLNSPIQGYQDPLCAVFAVLAVIAIYRRRPGWASVFLALGFMMKPQIVLVAPVVVWVGLLRHPLRKNLLAWTAGFAAALLVMLPFILAGRALSVVQGVLSITDSSHDLSRQALNLWWPVQYTWNAVEALRTGETGLVSALAGGLHRWYGDVPANRLSAVIGFPVKIVGLVMLAGFTFFNLFQVAKRQKADPLVIIEAAALQVYAYFILRVGVQGNHYFLLIPLLALACVRSGQALWAYGAASLVFLIQDLIFYGLGRDFDRGKDFLSVFRLGWTTVVLAAGNIVLFVWLCRRTYGRGGAALRAPSRD